MDKFQKDFKKWAEVAERVEGLERPPFIKVGAIYWCYLGVGIGSELVGKGEDCTRPVLVVGKIDERLVLVTPITTKKKRGGHYTEVIVNGRLENVILYQSKIVDVKRLGDFIDEVPTNALASVQEKYLQFCKRLFEKRISPT